MKSTFKLQIYSVSTLFALFSLLFPILAGVLYVSDVFSITTAVALTLALNLIILFINPIIMDFMNRWIYKTKYYTYEELKSQNYKFADFLMNLSLTHNIKFPRVGIIDDGGITAYTYGSMQNNARIVITKGLIDTLNERELNAVLAHEFGHIKHRDFIVMTVASTILQLLYLSYLFFRTSRNDNNNSNDKGSGVTALFALTSYIFYIIASYIILFLSRIREYYADNFSASQTSPKDISDALVKIGYGLFNNASITNKSVKLLNSTRSMNLIDLKYLGNFDSKDITNAVGYDIYNPWASLSEFNSTHPLIGKRLSALGTVNLKIDEKTKSKLWSVFFKDSFIYMLNFIFFIGILIAMFLIPSMRLVLAIVGIFLSLIISYFVINYRYPKDNLKDYNIKDLLNNLFASPVRGVYSKLKGVGMGKGVPGFSLSEDFYLKDNTGFIFINYVHWLPFMNWYVGYKKTSKLMNKDVEVKGWFFRSGSSIINADLVTSPGIVMNSYSRFMSYLCEIKYVLFYVLLLFLI